MNINNLLEYYENRIIDLSQEIKNIRLDKSISKNDRELQEEFLKGQYTAYKSVYKRLSRDI